MKRGVKFTPEILSILLVIKIDSSYHTLKVKDKKTAILRGFFDESQCFDFSLFGNFAHWRVARDDGREWERKM